MKFLLALSLLLGAASGLKMELRDHKNAPDAGGEWVSNGRGQDAQMADFSKYPPEKAAKLRATFQRLLEGDGEYGGYESNVVGKSFQLLSRPLQFCSTDDVYSRAYFFVTQMEVKSMMTLNKLGVTLACMLTVTQKQ